MPQVVEFHPQSTSAQIILRGTSPDDLTSIEARNLALTHARAHGFPAHGLKEVPHPYPVDANGKTGDDVALGRTPVAAWQADYEALSKVGA